jgi:hypothetical protein
LVRAPRRLGFVPNPTGKSDVRVVPPPPKIMAETKRKGDLGQAMIMADLLKRGFKVLLPYGEDWPFDLVVMRGSSFEKIQCKYTESDGQRIRVKFESTNNWQRKVYSESDVDWLAVYDLTTNVCYYVPSRTFQGRAGLYLRLIDPKNGKRTTTSFAKDFVNF